MMLRQEERLFLFLLHLPIQIRKLQPGEVELLYQLGGQTIGEPKHLTPKSTPLTLHMVSWSGILLKLFLKLFYVKNMWSLRNETKGALLGPERQAGSGLPPAPAWPSLGFIYSSFVFQLK
jgi:hypothetical protein